MFPVSAAINSKNCDSTRHDSSKESNVFLFSNRSNGSVESSISTTDTGRTTIITAATHNMRGKKSSMSSPASVACRPVDRNENRITVTGLSKIIYRCCEPTRSAIFAILGLLCLLCSPNCVQGLGEITWAVNCGGGSHTDIQGIRYQADYLKTGIASDYGKNLMIQRIVPQDQILYQTERYHTSTFGYEIPIKEDGDYVLVLKFCEVWFTSSNQKVGRQNRNTRFLILSNILIFFFYRGDVNK